MSSNSTDNQNVLEQEELNDNQTPTTEESTADDNMSDKCDSGSVESDNLSEGEAATEVNIDWKDKYMRLQAEFDNYRKRTIKEKMDLVAVGGADVIKAFLPMVDDMHRAVDAMSKSDDIDAVRNGINLIYNKMGEILKNQGVSEIEAIGLELDVDHHEAVARFAAGEDKSGKIIDVVERGYIKGERVIRFAKVVVGE